jgi:hypothetical protein
MAKDIDNSYASSANYIGVNSVKRSNPGANASNAVKLYGVERLRDAHDVSYTWAITSGGDQIEFTPATGATTATDYIKFRVIDQSGNEAYSSGFQSSAATTALAVDTSSLDPDDMWTVYYTTSNNSGASRVEYVQKIGTGAIYANSSGTESLDF